MANRYWIGTTSADPANTLNWSATSGGAGGASVPVTGDAVTFDGNGNNACTFSTNCAWASVTVLVGYTAKLDFNGFNLALDDGGNYANSGGGITDLGEGILSATNSVFTHNPNSSVPGTSTVELNGTCSVDGLLGGYKTLSNLKVNAGASITVIDGLYVTGTASIYGAVTINSGKLFLVADIKFYANSSLGGAGALDVYNVESGKGISLVESGVTINPAAIYFYNPAPGSILYPATYSPTVFRVWNQSTVANKTLTLSSGTYEFTNNFYVWNDQTKNLVFDCNTNNSTVTIKGDLYLSTYSTGTIEISGNVTVEGNIADNITGGNAILTSLDLTLGGSGNQSINLNALSLSSLVVAKTGGTVTFVDTWSAGTFSATGGTLDFNGQECGTTGNFSITYPAAIVAGTDAMNGCMITVNGEFNVSGQNGSLLNLRGTAVWYLALTGGNGQADYADISYCDAESFGMSLLNCFHSTNSGNNDSYVHFGLFSEIISVLGLFEQEGEFVGVSSITVVEEEFNNYSPFTQDEYIDTVSVTGGTAPFEYEIILQELAP